MPETKKQLFAVEVIETRTKTVYIQAESGLEAKSIAARLRAEGLLDPECHFQDLEIKASAEGVADEGLIFVEKYDENGLLD
jgi:hypothetical protein